MVNSNIEIEFIDFMELLNETLSYSFIEKWKYKYSEKFIKHFQFKILEAITKQKPLKREVLFTFLTKKCKYSTEQVNNFFNSIDISLYYPFIYCKADVFK